MLMILLACVTARPDTSDTDSMSDSDSSSTRDMDMDLDNNDPNLHNPQVEMFTISCLYNYSERYREDRAMGQDTDPLGLI